MCRRVGHSPVVLKEVCRIGRALRGAFDLSHWSHRTNEPLRTGAVGREYTKYVMREMAEVDLRPPVPPFC